MTELQPTRWIEALEAAYNESLVCECHLEPTAPPLWAFGHTTDAPGCEHMEKVKKTLYAYAGELLTVAKEEVRLLKENKGLRCDINLGRVEMDHLRRRVDNLKEENEQLHLSLRSRTVRTPL